MAYECITLEISDGIAALTLNRPQALNSLNKMLIDEMRAALRALGKDPACRSLLLSGAGRGFCAGADLANNGFADGVKRSPGEGVSHSMEIGYNPLVRDFAQFPKPTVVAVNGICAGGGVGLALGGDIVIAAKSASFVQVFGPKLGLVPDMGVTWFAPRLAGRARARGMALLGDKISAGQAAAWGLIWDAVEDAELAAKARGFAARLAAGPQLGFRRIKETLDASWENTLDEQLELERKTQAELGDTPDFLEGVTAFLQKREAKFG